MAIEALPGRAIVEEFIPRTFYRLRDATRETETERAKNRQNMVRLYFGIA
jgi:hypothetical protein